MCPSHPSQKQLPGLTTCMLCRKSRQRREHKCIIRGICVNSGCNNKTLDKHHTCPTHKWYSAAQTAGVTVQILNEIYEEQNGRCILSGIKITKGINASPDHIISKNDGGLNTKENIRLTDWMVNRALGKETDEQFIQMCKDVIKHQEKLVK